MPDSSVILALGAACLIGIGAGALSFASFRHRARRARSHRLALVIGLDRPAEGAIDRAQGTLWSIVRRVGVWFRGELSAHAVAAQRSAYALAVSSMFVGLLSGTFAWCLLVVVAAAVLAWLRYDSAAHRRLEQQAPAALEMLSAGLRAGYSVPQSIAMIGRESPEPTGSEFQAVGQELALGASLAEALTHLAERTALADYTLVSTVIWIHGQVGGNLAVVMDSVVATLRDRFDLREQVQALTAQQRMASTTLAMLPVAVLLLLLVVDRPFVDPLFSSPMGRLILGIACVLLVVGWGTMRLLSRVEL